MEQDSAYGSLFSVPKFLHSSKCSTTCTKCNSTFSNPRVLPCLHTFCTKCLETTNFCPVLCPVCNIKFCLPPTGIRSLIPDYGIMNFISSLKGKLYCTSCRADSSGAVAKCINCDNYLCHICLLTDNCINCFEGHHVIQFPGDFFKGEEENTEALPIEGRVQAKENENVMCIVHPESQVQLFCFTCDVPICQTCITEDHAGHGSDPINTIGEALLSIMTRTMEENRGRLEDLTKSIRSSHYIISWLNLQYKQVQNRINEAYKDSNKLLEKQHQIQMLESSFNKLRATLHNSSNISQDLYENTYRLHNFFSRLTKFGTVSQCLMFKKLLESKHKMLARNKPGPPLICNLKFVADLQDFTNFLNNTFSHVCDNIPFENVSTGPRIGEIPSIAKKYSAQGGTFPFKCNRWSNSSCLEDLKTISDHNSSLSSPFFRLNHPFNSTVSRQVIPYSCKFGSCGTLPGQFTEPNGVAINSNGDIIIADTNNNRVQIFDKIGHFKFLFGKGSNSTECGNLLFPNTVAVVERTGDIVVTERAPTHQVQIYNKYGQFIRKFGTHILQHPRAVAVDKDGYIIVVGCKVMRVVIFCQQGEVVHTFTCNPTLHFPNGVAVNDKRQIFISDNRAHCVFVYDYRGNFIRVIGHEGLTNYPIGVMLNKAGQVIVADNCKNFNLTVFTQEGRLVTAFKSKVKHAECSDCAITSDGTIVLTCRDCFVYLYRTPF